MLDILTIVKGLTDTELIEVCNSIWDWKHNPSKDENSYAFLNLYNNNKDLFENNIQVFDMLISSEASKRFSSLVKYLLTTKPHDFIK